MEKVDKLLEVLAEIIKQTKDAAESQLPLIAQEVVTYELLSAKVWVVVFGLLALTGAILFICGITGILDEGAMFLGIALSGVGFITTALYVDTLIKLNTAPKVFLLEYFTNQARKVTSD